MDKTWAQENFRELKVRYAGKFVAVLDGRAIAAGPTFRAVDLQSRTEYPGQVPLLFYVPGNDGGELFLKMVLR